MPQPLTLTTPGRWGVNEQEQNQLLHPNWATKADGLVINDSGNLQCRGALNLISTDGAPSEILRQFIYVNSAGNEVVISTTATKIISGTGDLDDASTDITPTGAPTNGYWQFQNFNGKVVGWQANHTPIVWSGSGDFAVITASSGTLPDGDCVLSAWGRLWAVDDDGQTIRICALLDETKWATADGGASIDMRNVWPKGMDRVVALAAFGGNLVIFGRRSIVIYTDGSGSSVGVDPAQMYVVDTIATGCACRDSVAEVAEGDLLFLSEVGLQSLGRVITNKDNPLGTISWQIADRLQAAIQTEIASATDLRTWTGSYIPGTSQYMLTHTTTEDVYVFHYGGAAQDDKGRGVVPITIWDTSILTNIRGFITRRSGITYTTGSSTHEIFQYDPLLSLDESNAAIPVIYDSGWLDLGGDFSQINKLLKMVQITVLNEAGIDSALTLRYAADYSTDTDTLTPLLTQDNERCVFLYDPSGDIEGQYFKLGFSDTSFGLKELTQITAQFKTGRTAFIHKNFNDVVDESFTAPTAPVITSLSPSVRLAGSAAFTMTITGTGFTVDSIASIDGDERVTTFVSSTSLQVAMLAGDIDTAGEFDITVENVIGGTSNAATLTVTSASMLAVGTNVVMYSDPTLATWTLGTPAASQNWTGCAYSPTLGRWVKCSSNGVTFRSAYSDDGGATWTASATPLSTSKAWTAVAWSDEGQQFVAVATSGGSATQRIATSPDGNVWTTLTHSSFDVLADIIDAPESGKMFALATGALLISSADGGTTWAQEAGYTATGMSRLAWSGSRLYAAGGGDVFMYFSADNAATWSPSGQQNNGHAGVAVKPAGALIAPRVSASATMYNANPTTVSFPLTLESIDGRNWTDVIWSANFSRFFAITAAADGSNPVGHSLTGLASSWTFPTTPAGAKTATWNRIREGATPP